MRPLLSIWGLGFALAAFPTPVCHAGCGPNQLGPFHVDRFTRVEQLWRILGRPRSQPDLYCYAGPHHKFLSIGIMDANPRLAGELMIASFPNCIGVTITRTHAEFGAWKTEQGIGLGSREGAVLRAYGPPTDRSWIYRDDPAVAYNPKLLPVPDLHVPVEQLRYAPPNVMRGSIFGIYRGRVVWIMLTDEG